MSAPWVVLRREMSVPAGHARSWLLVSALRPDALAAADGAAERPAGDER